MSDARLTLRSTLTSPFGRKVRMAAEALELSHEIDVVTADSRDENDTLRQQNPLGKIPCLLLEDGTPIYDSGVIIEYLQERSGRTTLVPLSGPARYQILTRARLADGITEAALLMVYEARFRRPDQISTEWLTHQKGKAMRGLAEFAANPPPVERLDLVTIGLSCALGYLDWRKPIDWRDTFPVLVDWIEAVADLHPAFVKTAIPQTS
jgi:glutathione S-transferase